jgi:hypothetical protein
MASRRKSMQVDDHERKLLVDIYLRWRIPVDQFESRPEEFEAICNEWRGLCRRAEPDGVIFHYVRNERKCGRWVVFNGNYRPAPPLPTFTAEETILLTNIYAELVGSAGEGSDSIAYDGETAKLIAARFKELTGRDVPPHYLVAKVTAIRKRGLLPPTDKIDPNETDDGFTDVNDIA